MPLHFCLVSLSSALSTTGDRSIRALVVVCRYLGDVLLATPLARSLTEAGYTVDWLVATGTQDLLQGQSCAHTVYTVDVSMPWRAQLALGMRLRRKYDAAFVLTASDRPMALAFAASRRVYALIPAEGMQYAWKRYMASQWIPYEDKQHMVWRAIRLGQLADLSTHAHAGLEWTDDDMQQIRKQLPWTEKDAYVQLHPFARWPYKWWNKKGWHDLITYLLDTGLRVAITGSPVEKEQAHTLLKGYDNNKVCALAGVLNWRQLACLSSHAQAYIGLDTANTHLAASTGTQVIALFGPTDPRIWGPWPNGFDGETPWQACVENGIQRSGNISLLQGTQDCVPCQLEGCERRSDSDSACLQDMQAQWVWQEIQHRLAEIAP